MFSMLTLCIKHIPNIKQDYGIDTDLVSIPRYYILVSYRNQNYGIEPSLMQRNIRTYGRHVSWSFRDGNAFALHNINCYAIVCKLI